MNARLRSIFEEAQKLSAGEREELAELLLATVDPDPGLGKAWADEVADRIAAHEHGDMPTRSAQSVLEKYLGK
ncbi:addiction module protein [Hyphomicrobium sp.]|uniref:addiction module protein n=1 Tax=Hyphomicrobium sp. TaxID=82 RepID=UPI0025B88E39|nr:addiction module protein [Hyphomicrobium sp.]MCC7250662.1 addiction module protein [Hyphomicrobium sp.]